MTATAPPGNRPPELQDWLNARIYHPLSRRLALALAPTPVTPNMVSVVGGLLVVVAAVAYVGLPWPISVAIGFALHLSWHVVDGADGDLARMTGRTSALGELIDGASDYLSHIILYVILTLALSDAIGGWAAWALAIGAGASHIVQANHAESQKRVYLWWAYGVPWMKQARVRRDATFGGGVFGRLAGLAAQTYVRLATAMNRSADAVDAAFARADGDPALVMAMRQTVRARGKSMLVFAKLVGPNSRVFLLAGAMLAGSAAWFFLAEIVLLNILLVVAMMRQRADNRSLAMRLAGIADEPPARASTPPVFVV